MPAKKSPSMLADGMGMGMAFVQLLVNELVAQGGFEEMLHPLTSERGQQIIRQVAKLIIESGWRVPRTLVERLATEKSRNELGVSGDIRFIEWDKHFEWNSLDLKKAFGIPVFSFSYESGSPHQPVPFEISEQIVGKRIEYPLLVQWAGQPHVVVNLFVESDDLEIGKVFGGKLLNMSLAPAKYFDLER